jgi:transcriptional regulator with XRE-family HTH domain
MAPAVGGLDPVDLSDDEGVAVFLAYGTADLAEGRATKMLGTVLDRLREWIIETDGRDTADDIIPRWTINSMMEAAESEEDTKKSGSSLSEDPEGSPATFASANTLSGALTDAVKAAVAENDDLSRADVVKEMADAAGVEASTVNGILRGEVEQPPKKRLVGFAQALGIDEQDLLDFLPDDTDTTDMSESADLTAEDLEEREQELDEREERLRQEMREQRREQAAAFAEQLADQGTILPRHKKTVTEALFHLEGDEEATVDLSANGGDEEAGVADAFRQMLTDLDPSIPTGEAAPAQGDAAATEEPADFSAPDGTQVREGSERMELHRKAKQYQRAHDVGYDEALDAVS